MNTQTTTPISPEEATDFINASGGEFSVIRGTSYDGWKLASELRGGQKADPNVGPAIRTAEALERRLEALAVARKLPPAPEPGVPRPVPAHGDLKAMLSDAGRDARYVKNLTQGGGGMFVGRNVAEALRVVRGLRPKLEAIWAIYETLPKVERTILTSEERQAFFRKMDALAMVATSGD